MTQCFWKEGQLFCERKNRRGEKEMVKVDSASDKNIYIEGERGKTLINTGVC